MLVLHLKAHLTSMGPIYVEMLAKHLILRAWLYFTFVSFLSILVSLLALLDPTTEVMFSNVEVKPPCGDKPMDQHVISHSETLFSSPFRPLTMFLF